MDELISVIVPIYNASKTLRRCVDSIINQSYPFLEILLIDDGSADGSDKIVDEYGDKDERIRVFHNKNGGLSSARNFGIEQATGSWISFVDADDWIEKEAYETVLAYRKLSDLYVFGRYVDTPIRCYEKRPVDISITIDNEEALRRLIVDASIGNAAWDKLYKTELLKDISFPVGYNYEDARTTYRVFMKANSITLIPDLLYHYVQYKGSIVHTQTLRNRLDHWTACYELYNAFEGNQDFRKTCITKCSQSILKVWGCLWKASDNDIQRETTRIREIKTFAKKYQQEFSSNSYKLSQKLGIMLAARDGRLSLLIAFLFSRVRWFRLPFSLYR